MDGEQSTFDILKQARGTKVRIEYVPEAETIRALRSLESVLYSSGWQLTGVPTPRLDLPDGVLIESSLSPSAVESFSNSVVKKIHGIPADAKSRAAAEMLFIFLKANNWDAERVDPSQWPPLNDIDLRRQMLIPSDTVSVRMV